MQDAGAKDERAEPIGAEEELIADGKVQVVVMRGRTGGRKCRLLDQRVVRDVTVRRAAQKPLRALGLLPIDSKRPEIIAKGHCHRARDGNGIHHGSVHIHEALRCQLRERLELRLAGGAVSDTGIFVHVFERGVKPEFVLDQRAADRADIILA